jgi:hypothetical protein
MASECPQCKGSGVVELVAHGVTWQVACGHEACRREAQRATMVELMRHLPPELTRRAKR